MATDNVNSGQHTEEELWQQIFSLSKGLQDCKSYLHYNTLDAISDKIDGIEKDIDVLLGILQNKYDK